MAEAYSPRESRLRDLSDPYEILGVSRDAPQDDIKQAYRKLSLKHHPDNKETGHEDDFKALGSAYAVLGDPLQRRAYDARNPAPRARAAQASRPHPGYRAYKHQEQQAPQQESVYQRINKLHGEHMEKRRETAYFGVPYNKPLNEQWGVSLEYFKYFVRMTDEIESFDGANDSAAKSLLHGLRKSFTQDRGYFEKSFPHLIWQISQERGFRSALAAVEDVVKVASPTGGPARMYVGHMFDALKQQLLITINLAYRKQVLDDFASDIEDMRVSSPSIAFLCDELAAAVLRKKTEAWA